MPGKPDRTEEDVVRGLTALALHNGNARAAQRATGIPQSTLRNWKTTKEDQLAELRADLMPRIYEQIAQEHFDIASQNAELEAKTLKRIEKELPNIPARDLPNTARNLATGSGIHTDKALNLRSGVDARPPTQRSLEEITRSLHNAGVTNISIEMREEPEEPTQAAPIEGTATELGDGN